MLRDRDSSTSFGLGEHSGSVILRIRWPDGRKQAFKTEVDRALTVIRGKEGSL